MPDMLEHGGRIRQAAQRYGIPPADWLDLSTGINPVGWPVPAAPGACWRNLPEDGDGLEQAARDYYGCIDLLVTAGSQAAIQALPRLRPPCRVGLLAPSYAEHALAWTQGGHEVATFAPDEIDAALDHLDVLLLVNPNNPTGNYFTAATLHVWQQRLAARGGWLVVDEAFMDATPQHSLAARTGIEGLVVLRSLGKFFGLAGARVGFVLAWPALLVRLAEALGPWTLANPSRWVAQQALQDVSWQLDAQQRQALGSQRLAGLLAHYELAPSGGTALFQWLESGRAAAIQDALAQQGIWVRRFDAPASLRFGLPGTEADWQRLETALRELR